MSHERDPKTLLTGTLVMFGAATVLAPITTLAKIAYEDGSNPATVIAVRYLGAWIFMGLLVLVLKRSFAIPKDVRLHAIGAGVAWFMAASCYMSSIAYIPVGLAAIILYTFPLIVAALAPFTEGAKVDRVTVLAFLIAFAGVALAIGPSFKSLDPLGILLAFGAACGSAALFLTTSKAGQRVDGFVLSFWSNFSGFLLSFGLIFASGWLLPQTSAGWTGAGLVVALYIVAMALLFMGTRLAGSTRSAMVMNLEPVLTLVFAGLFLGELLTTLQFAGGALVIAGVMLTTLRKPAKPRLPVAQGETEP